MRLAAKAPGAVSFDAEERWRISRARMALRLNKLPEELDRTPYLDIVDLVEVMRADDEAERAALRQQAARGARTRRRGRR